MFAVLGFNVSYLIDWWSCLTDFWSYLTGFVVTFDFEYVRMDGIKGYKKSLPCSSFSTYTTEFHLQNISTKAIKSSIESSSKQAHLVTETCHVDRT